MAEQELPAENFRTQSEPSEEETFVPVGSMFLMVMYIIIFAAAWGLVYFFDFLARR